MNSDNIFSSLLFNYFRKNHFLSIGKIKRIFQKDSHPFAPIQRPNALD
jgi:hypothetical protein